MSGEVASKWVAHVNVNTCNLEVSRVFYERGLGLKPAWVTQPAEPQSGELFDLPGQRVMWTGAMLGDIRGRRGPVVDLLEWTAPKTVTTSAPHLWSTGFSALTFAMPDLEGAVKRLRSLGRSPEWWIWRTKDVRARTILQTRDPSGVIVRIVEGPTVEFRGIDVNVTDLEKSREFYRATLGLAAEQIVEADTFQPNRSPKTRRECVMYVPATGRAFTIRLVQWSHPHTVTPPRTGNQAGIYRLAVMVDDIDAAITSIAGCVDTAITLPMRMRLGASMPDVIPVTFRDPDGACLELFQLAGAA